MLSKKIILNKYKVKIFLQKIKDTFSQKKHKDTLNLLSDKKKIYNFSSI